MLTKITKSIKDKINFTVTNIASNHSSVHNALLFPLILRNFLFYVLDKGWEN